MRFPKILRRGTIAASAISLSVVVFSPLSSETGAVTTNCGAVPSVSSLSTLQLVSQLIVPTISATAISNSTQIATSAYAGIMITGSTAPSNFSSQVAKMQQASPLQIPLFVMTDAEGGGVMRLANALPSLPWAQTMGKWNSDRIRLAASNLGRALASLGINMDLAPVADVDGRPQVPGYANPDGLRSFSGVPSIAGTAATAFASGLAAQNVVASAKHFPGIGYSSRNSDFGSALTKTWAQLQSTGLVPFRSLIAAGVPVIMMSNNSTPGFSNLPASLSPQMYAYLRSTLNFSGLTITDSLSAGAISALHIGLSEAAVRAVIAGADLVLLGGSSSVTQALSNANAARASLAIAVQSGRLPLATLQSDAMTVLSAKHNLFC